MKLTSLHHAFGKVHAEQGNAQLNRPVFRRQRGASAIEYAIIAAVIALAIFTASSAGDVDIAGAFETFFTKIQNALNS
ncbi:hypothetical protein GCM10009016_08050 [Halomonas beimenensis]